MISGSGKQPKIFQFQIIYEPSDEPSAYQPLPVGFITPLGDIKQGKDSQWSKKDLLVTHSQALS